MNVAVKKLAIYIRDLLSIDEQSIKIGRRGFVRDDFTGRQVVVDSTGGASILSRSETFDGDTEIMQYVIDMNVPCSVNFYGNTAWEDAATFQALKSSQKSYELQRDNGIAVYTSGSIVDVKLLTGEQYSGRVNIDLNVRISIVTSVDTLRIDEAVIDTFLTEA